MTRRRSSGWGRGIAVVLSLGLLTGLAVGTPAVLRPQAVAAAWTNQENGAAAITAGTLAAPSPLTCKANDGLIGLGSSVDLAWSGYAGVAGAQYQLFGRKVGTTAWSAAGSPTPDTSATLGDGLLGGLVKGLVDTLLGGGNGSVELMVVGGVGSWTSPPTPIVTVAKSTVLVLVYYKCS